MTGPVRVQRILIGVDFDDSSAAAVAVGGELAEAFGAALTAVHAETIDVPPYFTEAQVEVIEAERQQMRARLTSELSAFTTRYTHIPVEPVVEEKAPAALILEMAPTFDLIVLGTRRLRGPKRWWLGSVAEAVVGRAPVAVLVVPAAGEGAYRLVGRTVLAPATDDQEVEAWLTALGEALQVHVVRTGDIGSCPPDRLRDADLVVVPLPPTGATGAQFDAIVHVLKECPHPVLFIPAAHSVLSRRSS
jgi:nucleotide-binding universal stress UspA family protein